MANPGPFMTPAYQEFLNAAKSAGATNAAAAGSAAGAAAGSQGDPLRKQAAAAGQAGSAAGAAAGGWYTGNPFATGAAAANPFTATYDIPDLTQPSTTEKIVETAPNYAPTYGPEAFDQYGNKYVEPSRMQEVLDPIIQELMGMQPGTTNNQQTEYDAFNANRPDISTDAGLDPYYENAKKRFEEELKTRMAAGGKFGGSAYMDMLSEGMQNLNAEQANREAEYNLNRLAEERSWAGLGGELAQGADTSALENSQFVVDMKKTIGELAAQGEVIDTDKLNAYFQQALGVDEATANWFVKAVTAGTAADTQAGARVDRAWGTTFDMSTAISDRLGKNAEAGFTADQELLAQQLETALGPLLAAIQRGDYDRADADATLDRIVDIIQEAGRDDEEGN